MQDHFFSYKQTQQGVKLSFPIQMYTPEQLDTAAIYFKQFHIFNHSITIDQGNRILFTLEAAAPNKITAEIFSKINNLPNFYNIKAYPKISPDTPLVSCIIVLTCNKSFIKKQSIPALICNSPDNTIEIIIVVNNHLLKNYSQEFPLCTIIQSTPYCVAEAYNKGVAAAKGIYIAIMHDDFLINDAEWISKSITLLENEKTPALVTTTYSDLKKISNSTPFIFMQRSHYLDLGGFDANILMSNEDVEFKKRLLLQKIKLSQVFFNHVHLQGASTKIALSANAKELELLYALNAIPHSFQVQLPDFLLYISKLFYWYYCALYNKTLGFSSRDDFEKYCTKLSLYYSVDAPPRLKNKNKFFIAILKEIQNYLGSRKFFSVKEIILSKL